MEERPLDLVALRSTARDAWSKTGLGGRRHQAASPAQAQVAAWARGATARAVRPRERGRVDGPACFASAVGRALGYAAAASRWAAREKQRAITKMGFQAK
jgi:hypothetical protein